MAEGPECKALRVTDPEKITPALREAHGLMEQFRVPVLPEVILERVTNISMGTELDKITEFENLAQAAADAPTAIALSD